MQSAAQELFRLGARGLQLTPGLAPTENFRTWLEEQQITIRTHHGFYWDRLRCKVWSDDGDCLVASDSVHPPLTNHPAQKLWWQRATSGNYHHLILETMYPQYLLGSGEELERAMDLGLPLAVDVSHIYIQLSQGSLSQSIWLRLQNYDNIRELHLSSNTGRADIHQPLDKNTFGLDWVRSRSQDGTPVILECYLHRLSLQERLEQLELINI